MLAVAGLEQVLNTFLEKKKPNSLVLSGEGGREGETQGRFGPYRAGF
jgi:hypothetical protein